jgi:DNA-binding NtrC family response regulator
MVVVFEPTETFSLLVIDDEQMLLDLMPHIFSDMPVNVLVARDWKSGLDLVRKQRPQLVFVDLNLRGMHGLDVLKAILKFDRSIEVILFSGDYSSSSALDAIQRGASDFLEKPCPTPSLRARVARSIEAARKHRSFWELDSALLVSPELRDLERRSTHSRELLDRISKFAPHYRTALMTGPPDSGKESAARVLHDLSPVGKGPFVVCDCSLTPDWLLPRELFGQEKDTVAGAEQGCAGVLEQAHRGTLYLKEIGKMPLAIQSRFLRVLQTHETQRLGSSTSVKTDVRVIGSSTRDLQLQVEDRHFREDLYYRLSALHFHLP